MSAAPLPGPAARSGSPVLDWPRAADPSLRRGVRELIRAVAALGGAVGWTSVPAESDVDDWLDGVLDAVRSGSVRLAVVTVDDRVAGLGTWVRYAAEVLSANAEMRKVMTHPELRGRGLARLLVRALVRDARAAGVETMTLDVRGNNTAAMRLYESEGFQAWGRLPDFIAVGAERFDRVCYSARLTGPAGLRSHGGRREGPGAS